MATEQSISPVPATASLEPPSVLVLTRNEEVNIAACLDALSFSDDIVVLDSYSDDRTVEIARRYSNVRVVQRPFDTEYKQRNYGLHEVEYKHNWLYICDADERVPADLVDEILRAINDASRREAAYRLRYKNMYLGKWIKHSTGYPVWIMRLVQPKLTSYEIRETNVHPIVRGEIGELRGHFIHYSFNGGLRRWFEKHNFYSTREAAEGVKVRAQGRPPLSMLRDPNPMIRRRAAKNLSYFLFGRGVWRFLHSYLLRGGILDGTAGFHYCCMISMYEYWIELKMAETERPWNERADRLARQLLTEGGR